MERLFEEPSAHYISLYFYVVCNCHISDRYEFVFYCYRTLLAHMSIFSKMKNPRSMYREPDLNKVYLDLLTHKNPEVQKVALDCLMSYKQKFLVPYR
jgi:hypothetical protein